MALKSVANFRDFGGCSTADGSVIVRGQLFRSGHFSAATAEDLATLDALNVRFSVDLRHPTERARAPNKWEPPLTQFSEPMPAAEAAPQQTDDNPSRFAEPVGRSVMVSTYGRVPYDPRFIAALGKLVRTLADRGGPMIVHCSQGKDRTGIACALLLHVLGVGRGGIFADYLATNATIDRPARAREARAELEPLYGLQSDDVIEEVVGVDALYLQTSLDAIEAKSGSIDAYIDNILGVPPELQSRLRAFFLKSR